MSMGAMDLRTFRLTGGAVLFLLLASCTKIGNYAEKRANKAAYGNIAGAQLSAFGETDTFSIGEKENELLQQLLEMDRKQEEVQLISLADTIALAMANSRSYQAAKENLFIEALNLTETQKDFNWDTSASSVAASTGISKENGNVETFGENGVDGNLTLGISRTLVSGAKVSLGFTHAFLNAFSSPDTSSEGNAISLNIVQPLLNGFGPLVAKEQLRQAERDMVYAVREFKRYQQDFVIDIADQYYSALETRDKLINQRRNYESAVANREQTEAMAKAGRIKEFEAAQAKQSELNAADSLTLAISNYQAALDDFRYTLGIPIDLNVEPDPQELTLLEERGLVQFDIDLETALDSALSNRLDLINQRDAVEDRKRLVEIARRDFLPDLDASYNVTADPGFESSDQVSQDLTVSLDIPFDWTEKRNDYRIAQIRLDQAIRSLEAEEDDIRRDVRDLWRKLERNRSVYKNRLLSVRLSERRVENTELLLQQGKVQTRDLLDAQDDLLSSRNEATSALVDYTINRLRFWDAIERFEIDPKGMWYEQSKEEPTE
ncbi:TolC family protein [Verrucomicrobia bacterium S94]|nr:TolC family protein [Verrucomicrobia bacterium S94]